MEKLQKKVRPPLIRECLVNIECILEKKISLGIHHSFLGKAVYVDTDQDILDDNGRIDLAEVSPFVYNQGNAGTNPHDKAGAHEFSKKWYPALRKSEKPVASFCSDNWG